MHDFQALSFPRSLPWHGKCPAVAAVAIALASAAMAGDLAAPAKAAGETRTGNASVTTIVAGIVSYTRWPAQPTPIKFCTLGRGRGVDELLEFSDLGSAQRSVPVRAAANANDAAMGCDVIYFGTFAAGAMQDVMQRAVGRPVLMIGEGPEFCSDGGMFCLDIAKVAARLTVNLDAVARSGLQVNPSVLRIARGAPPVTP